jgi:hypothetical protein
MAPPAPNIKAPNELTLGEFTFWVERLQAGVLLKERFLI